MNTPSHFRSLLAGQIERFLSHHRALGKRFDSEEHALRLLDRFLLEHDVNALEQITPTVLEAFLTSRPRIRVRSYNHLHNVLQRLFRWLVAQDVLPRSPLHARARRSTQHRAPFLFEPAQVERLLACAAKLPDGPHARHRGITYRMIFALMYGLGLRVSEVARFCRKDLDLERRCLHIRQTKFAKSRLVPFGPRMAKALQCYLKQHDRYGRLSSDDPLFSLAEDGRRPLGSKSISRTFHQLLAELDLTVPPGCRVPRYLGLASQSEWDWETPMCAERTGMGCASGSARTVNMVADVRHETGATHCMEDVSSRKDTTSCEYRESMSPNKHKMQDPRIAVHDTLG